MSPTLTEFLRADKYVLRSCVATLRSAAGGILVLTPGFLIVYFDEPDYWPLLYCLLALVVLGEAYMAYLNSVLYALHRESDKMQEMLDKLNEICERIDARQQREAEEDTHEPG